MSVWAYIAEKGEYWGGVCSSEAEPKTLGKFMSDFARSGFEIVPVRSREEYLAKIKAMKSWNESPEWILKHAKRPKRTA